MARNHTVVFTSRDTINSITCASGAAMEAVEAGIWECRCCDCYLILKRTGNRKERRVEYGKNCSKHRTAGIDAR
ncbi:hypothetical protein [Streptomyces sp. NPDC015125]|uniref:hypothetical protein n=1 Tax=Streptomyces sp. NPDC015125 TaxID=3364938 RepID=UPI0036F55E3F